MRAMKSRAGRRQPKRRAIPSGTDPYLPWGARGEILTCKSCHSVYYQKRWYLEDEFPVRKEEMTPTGVIICPACRKIQDHFPGGVVTLRGHFLSKHKDEILHLVKNEEDRARKVNPLERIISVKDQGSIVEIHTTSERFAQRIGREVARAYKGAASYHWAGDDKFVRVDWEREE